MTGSELRQNFMIEELFTPGRATAVYTHYDRLLLIGVMPDRQAIGFGEDLARVVGGEFLLERRELGLINIGGPGIVRADGAVFEIGFQDALYLGMGTRDVSFESADPSAPAKFYMNSAPAMPPFRPGLSASRKRLSSISATARPRTSERSSNIFIRMSCRAANC
ncbi:4-deoxy-L-threo-5-hexosulose-uronate ketol-isomerase (plasmid) [Sinorhizobium sp. CCBAU 05631]|nr:4-deoxy-L-threo-5-hexosulose-uronate ketol-isomerase [Sinorhizobium sp. CCBAU 05631]